MSNSKYAPLFRYLDFFRSCQSFSTWERPTSNSFAYPNYHQSLNAFVDAVYASDLLKPDYLEYLDRYIPKRDEIADRIEAADLDMLRAILTHYVRGERFCTGLWDHASTEGLFLKILLRLKELSVSEN